MIYIRRTTVTYFGYRVTQFHYGCVTDVWALLLWRFSYRVARTEKNCMGMGDIEINDNFLLTKEVIRLLEF